MPRSKVILFGLFLLAAVILIIFVVTFLATQQPTRLSQEQLLELREEYPAYNRDHPLIEVIRWPTFQEVMERVDAIVIGEVIAEIPEYVVNLSRPLMIDERLLEKESSLELPPSTARFRQFEVKVIKHIAGEPVEDIIHLSYNAMFAGYEPDLSPGMSIITGIGKGRDLHEGKYHFSRFGTYYVIDDQYVLSTVDDEFSSTMNGQTLDIFIDHILEIRK